MLCCPDRAAVGRQRREKRRRGESEKGYRRRTPILPLSPSPFPRMSHLSQVPTHAPQAPKQAEEHTKDNQHGHLLRSEEDQAAERAQVAVAKQSEAGIAQTERQQSTEQALESAFEQERASNESIRRSYQAHDGDLPGALQDC